MFGACGMALIQEQMRSGPDCSIVGPSAAFEVTKGPDV